MPLLIPLFTRVHFYFKHFPVNKRLLFPCAILVMLFLPSTREFTQQALSDAFFQVSVFVAATLLIYYTLASRYPIFELAYLAKRSPTLEVAFASFLGALPGCGGAIVVVTQFTKGQASFGSVVAVLTATMGDAAFLLIASRPKEGLLIMAIGLVVGTIMGCVINALKLNTDFFTPTEEIPAALTKAKPPSLLLKAAKSCWLVLLIPFLFVSLSLAANVDPDTLISGGSHAIALLGSVFCVLAVGVWALTKNQGDYQSITCEDAPTKPKSSTYKAIQDTHFITVWVVAAFLLFEISTQILGLNLSAWFSQHAIYAPLIAILIGLLPGCGPQIVVTSLYLQGVIPFSALVGNAISNDGDALFPALALSPKAALLATLYSTIPALILGYSLYFFGY